MTFQEKIIILRKKKGLTQDEFASAVGVSRQAVYKWESGKSYPEVAKLLEIKILFGISIDDLLDENFVVELPEKKRRKRLPKEEKALIETAAQIEAEAEKEPTAVAVEETVEEIVEEAVVNPVIEPNSESPIEKEEPAPIKEEAAAPEKRTSFFGRLFGRK
jgi:transcriptional regulator with XRE-family HTH domain